MRRRAVAATWTRRRASRGLGWLQCFIIGAFLDIIKYACRLIVQVIVLTEGGPNVPVGNGGNEKEPVGGTNVPEGNGGKLNEPVGNPPPPDGNGGKDPVGPPEGNGGKDPVGNPPEGNGGNEKEPVGWGKPLGGPPPVKVGACGARSSISLICSEY